MTGILHAQVSHFGEVFKHYCIRRFGNVLQEKATIRGEFKPAQFPGRRGLVGGRTQVGFWLAVGQLGADRSYTRLS